MDAIERPPEPWWDRLDPRFFATRDRFELSRGDRLRVGTSAALDVVLRTVGAVMAGSLSLPLGYHPLAVRRTLADRDFYVARCDPAHPERFFARPPRPVSVTAHKPRWPAPKVPGGVCEDLRFESPFVPANPALARSYAARSDNRTAHARYWRHHGGPRPTIAYIHGFFADPYWLNEWFLDLPRFYALGCDVLLVTLPFHGPRQGCLSPYSGHGFFAGGIARVIEAFGQAVQDFRVFLDHLFDIRGVEKVGVTGISLGGYTTALLAAAEPRLHFAVPNVPVTSLPDLVLEWKPIDLPVAAMLKLTGMGIEGARQMFAVASPLTYAPALPRERLMIVGGIADRLAPPKHARILWEHWGRPQIEYFPGSHVVHFKQGRYLRRMTRFLSRIGFLD